MRILVAEDDSISRRLVVVALEELGHEPIAAADGREAWELYQRSTFDVIISDWFMPEMDGLELCRRVRADQRSRYPYFILLTVADQKKNALEAMEVGVDDFLPKPLDPDLLRVRLVVAARITNLHYQVQITSDRLERLEAREKDRRSFGRLIGRSSVMEEVFRRLRLAAQSDVSVLLTGESGTGKELAAQAVHDASGRNRGPLIPVNCAALPDSVLESELFGHVRGAFTDAHRNKPGLFELADGGTIFLDEMGDISPLLQKKLLRVIEEGELRRVGSDVATKVDVRLVSATHRDLRERVDAGLFREDLYYRICVFPIHLPALREHREDIPLLVDQFVGQQTEETGKPLRGVTPDALRRLVTYDWPGNVRELRNAIEHAFVLATGPEITRGDLPRDLARDDATREPEPTDLAHAPESTSRPEKGDEMEAVIEAVERADGNRTHAARLLGISRVALWKKIRRLDIDDLLPPSRVGRRKE